MIKKLLTSLVFCLLTYNAQAADPYYGVSYYGGEFGGGYAFEAEGSKITHIYEFCQRLHCGDGKNPNNLLLLDNGWLIGTTAHGGGIDQAGTIFYLIPSPDGWIEKYTYNFCWYWNHCERYGYPISGITPVGAHSIEGVSERSDGHGVLWRYTIQANGDFYLSPLKYW